MFCNNCGKEINNETAVCPHCGAMTTRGNMLPKTQQTNNLAIIGFILSFFVALAGLICSVIAYKRSKELNGTGNYFAIAGICISILPIALLGLSFMIFLLSSLF